MIIREGDILSYRIESGALLAGQTGICRINHFEKSGRVHRENWVYIDTKRDDGQWNENFARFAPGEIAFATHPAGEFLRYLG